MQPLANVTPLKPTSRAGAIQIDHVGQVFIGVSGNIALIRIAENWIKEHIDAARFQENAGVAKVAPACAVSVVSPIGPRCVGREKGAKSRLVVVFQAQRIPELSFR